MLVYFPDKSLFFQESEEQLALRTREEVQSLAGNRVGVKFLGRNLSDMRRECSHAASLRYTVLNLPYMFMFLLPKSSYCLPVRSMARPPVLALEPFDEACESTDRCWRNMLHFVPDSTCVLLYLRKARSPICNGRIGCRPRGTHLMACTAACALIEACDDMVFRV